MASRRGVHRAVQPRNMTSRGFSPDSPWRRGALVPGAYSRREHHIRKSRAPPTARGHGDISLELQSPVGPCKHEPEEPACVNPSRPQWASTRPQGWVSGHLGRDKPTDTGASWEVPDAEGINHKRANVARHAECPKCYLKLNVSLISPLQMKDSYLILDEYVSISRELRSCHLKLIKQLLSKPELGDGKPNAFVPSCSSPPALPILIVVDGP